MLNRRYAVERDATIFNEADAVPLDDALRMVILVRMTSYAALPDASACGSPAPIGALRGSDVSLSHLRLPPLLLTHAMEIWPELVDWQKFSAEYQPGVDWEPFRVEMQADPCDVGSLNVGVAEAFGYLQPHLPPDVVAAVGPLVVACSSVEIDGWPYNDRVPWAIPGDAVYAPETVIQVVEGFDAVPRDRLAAAIAAAWPTMAAETRDWMYVDNDFWNIPKPEEAFLEYLTGWREAFAEAIDKGCGLRIDAG